MPRLSKPDQLMSRIRSVCSCVAFNDSNAPFTTFSHLIEDTLHGEVAKERAELTVQFKTG